MRDVKNKEEDREERREAAPSPPDGGSETDARALRAAAGAEASYLLSVRAR